MPKIFLILFLFFCSKTIFAQKTKKQLRDEKRAHINALIKQDEEGVIVYHKHTAYGVKLTTSGYGGFVEIGKAQSVKKSMLYQFEITERKHLKEAKRNNSQDGSSISFVYGKQNFVYDVKLGVQQQILLGNKSNKNGVSISANFGGGINIGLLRPYYVQVLGNSSTTTKYIKYDSPDSTTFLSYEEIKGGPTFSKGWDGLKINPGIYIKGGFRFDHGKLNEMLKAVEIGITADLYSKKLAQMVYTQKQQFFVGAYAAIVFGKRK